MDRSDPDFNCNKTKVYVRHQRAGDGEPHVQDQERHPPPLWKSSGTPMCQRACGPSQTFREKSMNISAPAVDIARDQVSLTSRR